MACNPAAQTAHAQEQEQVQLVVAQRDAAKEEAKEEPPKKKGLFGRGKK